MNTPLDEKTSITMPKGTFLVLFEYLARSYDSWRRAGNKLAGDTFDLQRPDAGGRMALWQLEGDIERTLPEIFSAEYQESVAAWKQHLISDKR